MAETQTAEQTYDRKKQDRKDIPPKDIWLTRQKIGTQSTEWAYDRNKSDRKDIRPRDKCPKKYKELNFCSKQHLIQNTRG